MPTFVFGLPLHPLVVHAVVVLVPAAALGAATIAVWPSARRRVGATVVVVAALAAASVPLATSTGEGLEHNVPRTAAISAHTELGDQLLVFVAPLFVVVFALVVLDRRVRGSVRVGSHAVANNDDRERSPGAVAVDNRAGSGGRDAARLLTGLLAVVTVGLAVVSAVQVVRIGDSGARAAWGDVQYAPQPLPVGERED